MSKFEYPIASEALLQKLIEKVIYKSYLNLHVTVNTFRGAGKPSELRYLFANYKHIPNFKKDRVFLVLDLQSFLDAESAYISSLAAFNVNFGFLLSERAKSVLGELTSKETLGLSDYLEYIQNLLLKEGLSVTVMIENFKFSHDGTPDGNKYIEIIESIRKLNTDMVSIIFMNDYEFDDDSKNTLGKLWPYVTSNIVWGGEMLFDEASANQSFLNHTKKYNVTFDQSVKEKIMRYTYGDPSALKRSIMSGITLEGFVDAVKDMQQVSDYINLIGTDWIENRCREMLFNISTASLKVMVDRSYDDASEFLVKTGLVQKTALSDSLLNPILDYYVTANSANILADRKSSFGKTPSDFLSGQELVIFKYLLENKDQIISKDKVAEVIWGASWEAKYSDWAIDKLSSNLRKKLEENNYKKTVKSFKGKGIQLV